MMKIITDSEEKLQVENIPQIYKSIIFGQANEAGQVDVKVEKMTQGITNLLYKCSLACSSKSSSEHLLLLFKIWGPKTELLINRSDECRIMMHLHQIGQFPKVYSQFPNGIVYGWIEGRTLKCEDLSDPSIYPLIASTIRKWHQSIQLCLENSSSSFPAIIEMIRKVHQQCSKCPLPKEEIEEYCRYLEGLKFKIVFCHNDLLAGNIILSPDSRSVKLIDFEYSGWNWRSWDLANHFVEFCGLDLDTSKYPSLTARRSWIREYLGEAGEADGEEEEIQQIEHEISLLTPSVNLFWGLWALVQAQSSQIDFDYEKFASKRFFLFRNPHILQ